MKALSKTWLRYAGQAALALTLGTTTMAVQAQTGTGPIQDDNTLTFPNHYLKDIAKQRRDLLTETTVRFKGSFGEMVPANVFRPRNITAGTKLPVVLWQYGVTGNRNSDYAVFHAAKLALKGFVAVIVEGPGRGDRQPLPEGDSAFAEIENYLADYGSAVDYISTLPYVDASRISYVGISWGGITGIDFAARDSRIKATIALSTGGKLPFLSSEYDPVTNVGALAGRNLMMINGRFDLIINPVQSIALRNAAPADAVLKWVMSEHYFVGYDQNKLSDTLSDFINDRVP